MKFQSFTKGKPEVLKVRMYELIGALINSAIAGGGDDDKLHELDIGYFNDINNFRDIEKTKLWLEKVTLEIVNIVLKAHNNRSKSIINRAKAYIEENFYKPLTVKEVAREVFISPSYFLHLFKEKSGYTFTDYLTNVRLQKAKELLIKTENSITDIAYEAGFSNSNYFSSVFKNIEGITPSEYKKKYAKI